MYGIPRAGKTTLRKNLLGQSTSFSEASTQIAEVCNHVIVERAMIDKDWKWAAQSLDEFTCTLVRCISSIMNENTLQNSNESCAAVEEKEVPLSSNEASSPVVQNGINGNITSNVGVVESSTSTNDFNYSVKNIFFEAINTGDWSKVLEPLSQAVLLQVIDTGGQPSFQEILPTLVTSPSISLLISKLTDDLETPVDVEYMNKDGNKSIWQDKYIMKDFVLQTLSSIPSVINPDEPSLPSSVLLIGTHKDKVESAAEKERVHTMKTKLHGLIRETVAHKKRVIDDLNNDFLIEVDSHNDSDVFIIRERIHALLKNQQRLHVPEVAASWLVFDVVLHKYAEKKNLRKMDIAKCEEIATAIGIHENITKLLQYLHSDLGSILHFSEIPELSKIVIIDFQLIFDSISEIVINHLSHKTHSRDKECFAGNGYFQSSQLHDITELLTVSELLALMKYRHIVAKVHVDDDLDFFMPSVLPLCKLDPNESLNSDISMFLVLLDCGFSPFGLFCAMAACLINSHHWELQRGECCECREQFRNRMKFYTSSTYEIIISAFSTHYEVRLNLNSCQGEELTACQEIISAVGETFTTVCEDLKCGKFKYGFYCHCNYTKCKHPAKLHEKRMKMKCIYSGMYHVLPENHGLWNFEV